MENDKVGSASPTAATRMPAARGVNRMPKIPDAADEIKVLHTVKATWRSCEGVQG
jgi:hypothetical protein